MTNVLAVGAHPDDVELGCAGTLAKHIEKGDNVHVLIMTLGERGKHTPNMEECKASLKHLGISDSNIIFGNFKDGFLSDDYETCNFIENIIKKHSITKIYTHAPQDRHQDHRNCSHAVSAAARRIPDILLFEGPSTNANFEPHYIVELLERHMQKKVECLENYKTQIAKGIVDIRFISNLAGTYGSRFNKKFAEGFALNHTLKGGNDV